MKKMSKKPISKQNEVATQITTRLKQSGVHWIKLWHYFRDKEQACVDGRDDQHVIGMPGGDMGALILKIMAAETVFRKILKQKKQFSQPEIAAIFQAYLKEFGKFYMHTDQHALEHLWKELQHKKSRVFTAKQLSSLTAFGEVLRAPQTPSQRQTLLKYLVQPQFTGCGHLRLMLQQPQKYGIRLQALQQLITAYYQTLWDDPQAVEFTILPGDHQEQLVLVVKTAVPILYDSRVPAIQPNNQAESASANYQSETKR